MEIYSVKSFSDFEPWGPAVENWAYLENNGYLEQFKSYLESIYSEDKIEDITLNDILAYEFEEACEAAGILPSEDDEEDEE